MTSIFDSSIILYVIERIKCNFVNTEVKTMFSQSITQILHRSIQIFNANETVPFSLETGRNRRRYSTNTLKSIKFAAFGKDFISRRKFRKLPLAIIRGGLSYHINM